MNRYFSFILVSVFLCSQFISPKVEFKPLVKVAQDSVIKTLVINESGAGFIISSDGYVLTCGHVARENKVSTVRTKDGKEYEADLVAVDYDKDIAVLKIRSNEKFPFFKFNKKKLEYGEQIIIIGFPIALDFSVATGIVGAFKRDVNVGFTVVHNALQLSAPVNRGNSGGPTINMDGEICGMVFALILSANDIGFSIPSEDLENFCRINDINYGS